MEKLYLIQRRSFYNLITSLLKDNKIFAPVKDKNEGIEFRNISTPEVNSITDNEYRLKDPILKKFFFKPYLQIPGVESAKSNFIILGAKACDLSSLCILDGIFLSEPADIYYKSVRDNTLLISSDCTDCLPTCFCTKINGLPYPEKNFDLNLSLLKEGYLIKVGSAKGEKLIAENLKYFSEANQELISERDKYREKTNNKIRELNKEFNYKNDFNEIVKKMNIEKFRQEISKCVSCAACRNVCPACHCFYLSEKEDFKKDRFIDACQYTTFARVAGGANPRKTIEERYRNLYNCKLVYKKENFECYACVGCGRCILACQAKIDIRKVLTAIQ